MDPNTSHTTDDVRVLLEHLPSGVSIRKRRLFAAACARRFEACLDNKGPARKALEAVERYADGLTTPVELRSWQEQLEGVCEDIDESIRDGDFWPPDQVIGYATAAVSAAASPDEQFGSAAKSVAMKNSSFYFDCETSF